MELQVLRPDGETYFVYGTFYGDPDKIHVFNPTKTHSKSEILPGKLTASTWCICINVINDSGQRCWGVAATALVCADAWDSQGKALLRPHLVHPPDGSLTGTVKEPLEQEFILKWPSTPLPHLAQDPGLLTKDLPHVGAAHYAMQTAIYTAAKLGWVRCRGDEQAAKAQLRPLLARYPDNPVLVYQQQDDKITYTTHWIADTAMPFHASFMPALRRIKENPSIFPPEPTCEFLAAAWRLSDETNRRDPLSVIELAAFLSTVSLAYLSDGAGEARLRLSRRVVRPKVSRNREFASNPEPTDGGDCEDAALVVAAFLQLLDLPGHVTQSKLQEALGSEEEARGLWAVHQAWTEQIRPRFGDPLLLQLGLDRRHEGSVIHAVVGLLSDKQLLVFDGINLARNTGSDKEPFRPVLEAISAEWERKVDLRFTYSLLAGTQMGEHTIVYNAFGLDGSTTLFSSPDSQALGAPIPHPSVAKVLGRDEIPALLGSHLTKTPGLKRTMELALGVKWDRFQSCPGTTRRGCRLAAGEGTQRNRVVERFFARVSGDTGIIQRILASAEALTLAHCTNRGLGPHKVIARELVFTNPSPTSPRPTTVCAFEIVSEAT